MATVKENIMNALTWFYERLKSNDLDPMQEQIDELNTNLDVSSFDKTNVTLESNNTNYAVMTSLNFDVTREGYTPLGTVGIRVQNGTTNGSNCTSVFTQRCYLTASGDEVIVNLSNVCPATAIVDVRVFVLYKKN